jgi:hypothetical protein
MANLHEFVLLRIRDDGRIIFVTISLLSGRQGHSQEKIMMERGNDNAVQTTLYIRV